MNREPWATAPRTPRGTSSSEWAFRLRTGRGPPNSFEGRISLPFPPPFFLAIEQCVLPLISFKVGYLGEVEWICGPEVYLVAGQAPKGATGYRTPGEKRLLGAKRDRGPLPRYRSTLDLVTGPGQGKKLLLCAFSDRCAVPWTVLCWKRCTWNTRRASLGSPGTALKGESKKTPVPTTRSLAMVTLSQPVAEARVLLD